MSEYYVTRTTPSGAIITELVVDQAPAAPTMSRVTRLAFRNRFTTAEKIALYNAAKTSVEVQIYLDDVNAASYIDLQWPDTRASVQYLESLGLIAPGRALGILDSPIQDDERLDN